MFGSVARTVGRLGATSNYFAWRATSLSTGHDATRLSLPNPRLTSSFDSSLWRSAPLALTRFYSSSAPDLDPAVKQVASTNTSSTTAGVAVASTPVDPSNTTPSPLNGETPRAVSSSSSSSSVSAESPSSYFSSQASGILDMSADANAATTDASTTRDSCDAGTGADTTVQTTASPARSATASHERPTSSANASHSQTETTKRAPKPDPLCWSADPIDPNSPAARQPWTEEPLVPAVFPLPRAAYPAGVTVVQDRATARRVSDQLRTLKDAWHACDTECIDIDVKSESPIGHGKVICASIYCGPEHDFGNGPIVWIDNLGPAEGVLDEFKPYFEDENIRKVWHNYSFDRHVLHNHGIDCRGFGGDTMHMTRLWEAGRQRYSLESVSTDFFPKEPKITIKDRFGAPKLKKDGNPSKALHVPELDALQQSEEHLANWIDYSAMDAVLTWRVRKRLQNLLEDMPWNPGHTMFDYYLKYWRPFGELLTDMERAGIYLDKQHLKTIEKIAQEDVERAEKQFLDWASKQSDDAKFMNMHSDAQKRQLFFAPCVNRKTGERLPVERTFQTENTQQVIEEGQTKAKKKLSFQIRGMGMPSIALTTSGWPQVNTEVMKALAGNPTASPPVYGKLFDFLGGGASGKEASLAVDGALKATSINKLLNTFIVPLQTQTDEHSRIHSSMNLNTETGRLSCRRPNLQNQPALEKDRYRVRAAFASSPGCKLIVADYGQLELRLLAHMTKCRSMIEAFEIGGDFHSRTAVGMYSHLSEAVARGDVLLEWDSSKGSPPVPLVKDKFTSERRRAKTLNFSIAYGKTAIGLSKDWGVSITEAQQTLDLWFNDRPEVRDWQRNTIEEARRTGYTRTLMGRYRSLPGITSNNRAIRGHAERAAINTPLQGGAADVVMMAMLRLHANERLRALGWRLILQIHDELIIEGPEESAEEARQILVETMAHPFQRNLLIELVVDASIGDNWAECK